MTKTTKRNPFILYYATFVAKGVRFLNKNVPGWTRPNKLAITDLNLRDARSCVLGQLAAKSALTGAGYELTENPDYFDAVASMQIDGKEYGFNVSNFHLNSLDTERDSFHALNHLWAHAIRLTRRGEKVTVAALRAIA